jgi:hypothetical protein
MSMKHVNCIGVNVCDGCAMERWILVRLPFVSNNVHMHWKHVVVLIMDPIHIVYWLATIHDTTLLCMLRRCRYWVIKSKRGYVYRLYQHARIVYILP